MQDVANVQFSAENRNVHKGSHGLCVHSHTYHGDMPRAVGIRMHAVDRAPTQTSGHVEQSRAQIHDFQPHVCSPKGQVMPQPQQLH